MAKITDFTGIDWALMAAKDSAGRVYIRAYRNAWDAKKKRSYMKSKIHVGRLLDDGSIRLSKRFVERALVAWLLHGSRFQPNGLTARGELA